MAEVIDNARRRDRAAQAVGSYDTEVTRGARSPRVRSAEEAAEAISELLCDLRHLADEFHLDWYELEREGERFYRNEAERHVVEVTTEGFQIRDTEADRLRADVWSSRTDAETACNALNDEVHARAA